MSTAEHRRAPRRRVETRVDVVDVMTGEMVGQVANVSEHGLLMLARLPMQEDCLFQLRFSLPDLDEGYLPIDVGVHMLWTSGAATGQTWLGARFLSLTDESQARLRAWIHAPGATYV